MTQDIQLQGQIVQKNDELREVVGWASVATVNGEPLADREGDVISMASLRKAANAFMDTQRVGGYMHAKDDAGQTVRVARIVGSMIIDKDVAKALKMDTPYEGWLITAKVENDQLWNLIKQGHIGGFSIGGTGRRIPRADQ